MAKTPASDIPDDIRTLSFEEALAGLEEIVRQLEAGQVSLEESITIYTRGTHLRLHCQEKLRAAQEKVEKIVAAADGAVRAEPADLQ